MANKGKLGQKQPNLKSVSKSEVLFPVKRTCDQKLEKFYEQQVFEFFRIFGSLYGLILLKLHKICTFDSIS